MLLAHAAGWSDGWSLAVLAGAAPALVYLLGVHRLRRRGRRPWSRWRTASFLAGSALAAVALCPPLEARAVTDPSAHMAQHLLLGMYAPVGLVLGAPVTLLLGAVPVPARRTIRTLLHAPVVRAPTHLLAAATLNVGGLYVVYLTPLHAMSTRSEPLHHLVHAHVLLAGTLFAWAVAGPDPAPRRPGTAWRVAVLVAAAGAHGFLAKLLFARAPALPPATSLPVVELEQAAQLMYYGGHLAELLLLTAVFASWYRRAPRLRRWSPALSPTEGDERAFLGSTASVDDGSRMEGPGR